MSAPAIQLDSLSKSFGRGKKRVHAVVENTLTVDTGQVYGFLGPNGAGKTTVIRLILDLLRPTAGSVRVFDQPVRANPAVLRRVGAMVEGAAFYPYLSGRKNLRVIARTHGDYDSKRIDAVLDHMQLRDRADQRVKGYSLGMKQRLGLAAALLHDPALVILDEPTNGLDPAGIQQMRGFIRDLVEIHGKTVFLSSHMLNEVEQICDRVAIINKGRIIREGSVTALLDAESILRVDARPLDQARSIITHLRHPIRAVNSALHVEAPADAAPAMVRALVEQGMDVFSITPQKQSLEDYFLNVTNNHDISEEADHA